MLDLLERCRDVESGIAYLTQITHLGGGSITRIDADSRIAICESTHHMARINREPKGWSVRTNHFTDLALSQAWARGPGVGHTPPEPRNGNGNTESGLVN
jgi:hypothetical protein